MIYLYRVQWNLWSFPGPQDKYSSLLHPQPLNNWIMFKVSVIEIMYNGTLTTCGTTETFFEWSPLFLSVDLCTHYLNINIFYCLNNDKRIRHKFFNLVLSSPYTYNIQYKHYYYIISLKFSHEDMKQKCSNKAECNNGIPLKVTNQTDPSIKKTLGHR